MEKLKEKCFRKQNWFLTMLGMALLFVFLVPKYSMAQEQIENHVIDGAGYFTEDEIEELEALCLSYGEESDSNIVMLVEDGIESGGWKTYMEDYYDENAPLLGNCALLLLDVNEKERRIEIQGYGEMEYYLTDERIETVIDNMLDDLKAGDYYSALASFPAMVYRCYEYGYGEDARTHTEEDNESYDPYYYEESSGVPVFFTYCLMALPVALIFAGIGTFVLAHGAGGRDTTNFRSYMDNGKNGLIGRYDRYTHTTTTRRRKPQDNGGRGHSGHAGGGGVSSGGHSHSGGGRSF
jgi:uncharacterized protein